MDAHDLPSISSPAVRRLTRSAVFVLAVMFAWALWRGYGAWLFGGHVH